jgi:hypothetical protein
MPTISLQELRAKIGQRAKSAPAHRFWGMHVHLVKLDTLEAAYLEAKRNGGAPGTDGETFESIEGRGRSEFLAELESRGEMGLAGPDGAQQDDVARRGYPRASGEFFDARARGRESASSRIEPASWGLAIEPRVARILG